MSFIYGERLIEYAIRIGTDDLQNDQNMIDILFNSHKHENEGREVTPPDADKRIFESLPMDYFQQRLAQIPKTKAETGKADIFGNSIPSIPDIAEYLQTANIKIVHGFPREAQDLPCICITLGNEDENQYLGTQKAELHGGGKHYKMMGSDHPSQYNINVITTNYDETMVWYYIIKYALLRYRPTLEAYGLREQKMAWMDIEPAPEYLQAGLFVYQRSCILSCVKEEAFAVEEKDYHELEFGVNGVEGDGTIIPDPE